MACPLANHALLEDFLVQSESFLDGAASEQVHRDEEFCLQSYWRVWPNSFRHERNQPVS